MVLSPPSTSTESVHQKRPDLCNSLFSSTCSRFNCRSSLVHQCVVPLLVVLLMLRLRWALFNNPSCLMHRLHIVIVHPLVTLGVRWSHKDWFFFLSGLFLFIVTVKKKEGSRGGGILYGNRKQEQKHTATAPVSQCF